MSAMEKNNSFSITGVMINVFVDGLPVNVVTNINVSIRRDIQPVYSMFGNPNPIAFAYNVRRIGGMVEFASIDGFGAMQLVQGKTTWLSLTEGFSLVDQDGLGATPGAPQEIVSDEQYNTAVDDKQVKASLGPSNFNNSRRSSQVMRSALESFIKTGTNAALDPSLIGSNTGVVTWSKQPVVYLDQATNLTVQFMAMIENKGYMYTRTLFGVTFHTHNIAIGMQVGSVEEGHYYAYQMSPWSLMKDLDLGKDTVSYLLPTEANPYAQTPIDTGNYVDIPGSIVQTPNRDTNSPAPTPPTPAPNP